MVYIIHILGLMDRPVRSIQWLVPFRAHDDVDGKQPNAFLLLVFGLPMVLVQPIRKQQREQQMGVPLRKASTGQDRPTDNLMIAELKNE